MLEEHLLKIPKKSEQGIAFASSSRHLLSLSEYLGIGQYGQFQRIMIKKMTEARGRFVAGAPRSDLQWRQLR